MKKIYYLIILSKIMRKISKYDFIFENAGKGAYYVTYTTPIRGIVKIARITNMMAIDSVRMQEYPTQKAMRELIEEVKRNLV